MAIDIAHPICIIFTTDYSVGDAVPRRHAYGHTVQRQHLTPCVKAIGDTSNVHSNNVNNDVLIEHIENCFRLNPRLTANNNVKFPYFCHNFDSYTRWCMCIHIVKWINVMT